jgi:hypothetical protein
MVRTRSKIYALTWFCCLQRRLHRQRRFLHRFGLKLIVLLVLSIFFHQNFTSLSLPTTDKQGKQNWVNMGVGARIFYSLCIFCFNLNHPASFRLSILGFYILHFSISKHHNYLENIDVRIFSFFDISSKNPSSVVIIR